MIKSQNYITAMQFFFHPDPMYSMNIIISICLGASKINAHFT
jgi:hypothetical protein